MNLEKDVTKEGAIISGVDSIDYYQYILRQIAYKSDSPVTYVDRAFTLSCSGVDSEVYTNELRVQVRFIIIKCFYIFFYFSAL